MQNQHVRNGALALDKIQGITFGRHAQKFGEAYARWDAARNVIERELSAIDRKHQDVGEDGKPAQKTTEQRQFAVFADPLARAEERDAYLEQEYEGTLPRIKASWMMRHLPDPRTGLLQGNFAMMAIHAVEWDIAEAEMEEIEDELYERLDELEAEAAEERAAERAQRSAPDTPPPAASRPSAQRGKRGRR